MSRCGRSTVARSLRVCGLAMLLLGCGRAPQAVAVRDDLGRAVAVPQNVRRIVTLAPNLTEIAFAIGAGDRVVATDDFSDTPPPVVRLPKVGGLQPNVERIAAARPDIVFATTNGNHPALAPALEALHVPLFVLRTDRIGEIAGAMERMGAVAHAPAAANAANELRRALAAQQRVRRNPPRVLFAVWTDPLYVGGANTFAGDLLALTGARNAVTAAGWPQYAIESIVAAPPDLLLYPNRSVTAAQVEALLRAAPELRAHTQAVAVDENRFTRPGPSVATAAADLNRLLDRWEGSH